MNTDITPVEPLDDKEKRTAIAKSLGWEFHASRDQFINGQWQATPDVWVWEDDGATLEYPELPDDATLKSQLAEKLDALTITSENIGLIRSNLLMPFSCNYNGWVRELTAEREKPISHFIK